MLAVFSIVLILVAIVGVSVTKSVENARKSTALSGIESMFRAAQSACLATNRQRRVVIETRYSGDGALSDIYSAQPVVRFWVERKKNESKPNWEPDNYSDPLDDVLSLPGGVSLTDVDGGMVIPTNPTVGLNHGDGTYSWYVCFVFGADGQIKTIQGRKRSGATTLQTPEGDRKVNRNPALHFMYRGTTIDMTGVEPTSPEILYIDRIKTAGLTAWSTALESDTTPTALTALTNELYNAYGPTAEPNLQFAGRSQVLTLYMLRITGLTASFDYGVYQPWPRVPLPDELIGS
jgi:hypothetical protein